MNASELGAVLTISIYNLALLAGCAYLVVAFDWSAWWMLLAVCFLKSITTGKAAEEKGP